MLQVLTSDSCSWIKSKQIRLGSNFEQKSNHPLDIRCYNNSSSISSNILWRKMLSTTANAVISQVKLYIPSTLNTEKELLSTANWTAKYELVSGRLAYTSSTLKSLINEHARLGFWYFFSTILIYFGLHIYKSKKCQFAHLFRSACLLGTLDNYFSKSLEIHCVWDPTKKDSERCMFIV